MKIHPDIIVSMGDLNDASVSSVDRIQQQLGIPVVVVDGSLQALDKAYVFLGDPAGEKDRAQELGAYCRQTVDEVTAKAKQIPPEKQVRVYDAEGIKALRQIPKGRPTWKR